MAKIVNHGVGVAAGSASELLTSSSSMPLYPETSC